MRSPPNPLALTVCWLLGLIWLLPVPAPGQNLSLRKAFGRYQQYVWQVQQGLPQNSVNASTGTRDGYLWLATFEGVARFDGVRFTVFDHSNTAAFKSNQIMALLEDRAGDLWLGTNGGGLIRRSHNAFRLYTTSDGLSNNFVRALAEDAEGNLWIGTEGGGLNRFRDRHFAPGRVCRTTTFTRCGWIRKAACGSEPSGDWHTSKADALWSTPYTTGCR